MKKRERLELISRLLAEGKVKTQKEILESLKKAGCNASQATISRDLRYLEVARIPSIGGKSVYAVAEDLVSGNYVKNVPRKKALEDIRRLTRNALISANTIVLRTFPGNAQPLGVAVDRCEIKGILGCIAGEDTVFVVVDENVGGKEIVREMTGRELFKEEIPVRDNQENMKGVPVETRKKSKEKAPLKRTEKLSDSPSGKSKRGVSSKDTRGSVELTEQTAKEMPKTKKASESSIKNGSTDKSKSNVSKKRASTAKSKESKIARKSDAAKAGKPNATQGQATSKKTAAQIKKTKK